MQTNDRQITELMQCIHTGKAQLPDFQRGWVWDDDRIKALIASITCNYPVGAAMFLEYGNSDIRYKEDVCQVFENVNTGGVSLTVFELVTAVFAMDDFVLRKDWVERKSKYFNGDILSIFTIVFDSSSISSDILVTTIHH